MLPVICVPSVTTTSQSATWAMVHHRGYLDGSSDGAGGYLVTDWVAGRLLAIDAGRRQRDPDARERLGGPRRGHQKAGMVYIPMMNNDTLRAYRLD